MIRTALAALAVAALPALSRAQPMPPPAPDRAWDRMELKQDRRGLADDRWDLARAEQLLARYDDARARRDRWALSAVERDVLRFLDRELRESWTEVRWADDRREVRDDRRDLYRVKAIRADLWSLRGRMDRRALQRKRGLVAEVVQVARAELREDRFERREDGREARADRRW